MCAGAMVGVPDLVWWVLWWLTLLQVDESVPGDLLRTSQLSGCDQAAEQEADRVVGAVIQETCYQSLKHNISEAQSLLGIRSIREEKTCKRCNTRNMEFIMSELLMF